MDLEYIEQNIWNRRSDLRGNHFRYIFKKIEIRTIGKQNHITVISSYSLIKLYFISIVAAISPPFTTYLEHGCSSSKCFKGIYADTFVKLSKTMNFTFTIEHIKTFGGLKDGKWTGMIGNHYRRLELAL